MVVWSAEITGDMNAKAAKVKALEAELAALKKQWPAHSVSPAMVQRFDELEDALAQAQSDLAVAKEKKDPDA